MKAIIFDMDGVIVDTEYMDFQLQSAYIMSISQEADKLTHEDFSGLVGRSGKDLYQKIIELSHSQISYEEMSMDLKAIDEQKYQTETIKKLFRHDLLKIVTYAKENGILLALASSSSMEAILAVLNTYQLAEQFDLIVTGEDFNASKPHPEIYLHCLQELGLDASEVLVIEDSPSGIAAAKAAGLTVIAYEEKRMKVDQSAADYILPNMLGIFDKIKELTRQC